MSAPRIRMLSETTINRIAAGEVIERPAAAVRELVENALDAGARRISVAIDGGGIDRIEVADDGIGMSAAELALAVQRHATSKLDDEALIRITTLGFRGEALPSIGAAARLSITARPRAGGDGHAITVEGGAVGAVVPAAAAAGTRVVVRDLFFATPARRKFLKSVRSEGEAAAGAVRRLAFAAPGVAFRLELDGREVFDLPAQTLGARVAALLGAEAVAALIAVEAERGAMRLEGFAGTPAAARASAAWQTLIVNGRPVTDPLLRTAVRVAYRDVIAVGRHPVVVLFLTLPAEALDVNVHPAKAEVRFEDAEGVRALVIGGLARALAGGAGAVRVPVGVRAQTRWSPPPLRLAATGGAPAGGFEGGGFAGGGFAEMALPLAAAPAARVIAPATLPQRAPAADFPLGAAVAQVLDTYIIAVAGDGALVLVDQHAAHERLTQEALRAQALAGGVRSQPLLLPGVVDLPAADAARLLARDGELAALGLEIEAFGPGAVLVRAMPAALGTPEPGPLLRDIADELAEMEASTALQARLDAILARMACHGSIRAGRRLGAAEMDALLRRMEATPRAATCSHGRPTFLKLTKGEIERLFGRR